MNKNIFVKKIRAQIQESINIKGKLSDTCAKDIAYAAERIITALKRGRKLLLCGNGGSAADAQHIAGEFVGRFRKQRRPLPVIALNTNTSILTSIGNDFGYNLVFSKQVEALGEKGDILIAISTSGRSANIIKAVKTAKKIGIFTIALTGGKGSTLKSISDLSIIVPSNETPRIQEAHILTGHIICALVEDTLFT